MGMSHWRGSRHLQRPFKSAEGQGPLGAVLEEAPSGTPVSRKSRYRIPVPHQWYHYPVPVPRKGTMVAITATEARKKLFPLIKQVNDDRAPIEIVSNHGRAYLVAADDYESMIETDYLLRSPANAARLTEAANEVRRGRTLLTKTMEELAAMADEGGPR